MWVKNSIFKVTLARAEWYEMELKFHEKLRRNFSSIVHGRKPHRINDIFAREENLKKFLEKGVNARVGASSLLHFVNSWTFLRLQRNRQSLPCPIKFPIHRINSKNFCSRFRNTKISARFNFKEQIVLIAFVCYSEHSLMEVNPHLIYSYS